MSLTFLEGSAISAKINQTIKEADDFLILISPYIKLNESIKSEILYLVNNKPEVEIEVVFGKNENKYEKSLSFEDYTFFKNLPNIRISYIKDLHAKIYCSEDRIMLSSMNLHSFSQANNFEAALVIEHKKSLLNSFVDIPEVKAWDDALDFIDKIISNSNCVFAKGVIYKSKYLGLIDEIIEEFEEDNSISFYNNKQQLNGYCIRTGKQIPFNIENPYSEKSLLSWQKYNNKDYKEKYCHYSGEESNGGTSFKAPILKKNWKLAKEKYKF